MHFQVAALGQIGFVLRPFHLQMAQALGFLRALNQLGTRNALTGRLSPLNAFVYTQIIRHDAPASSLVVAHGHAFSTLATNDDALQERRPLPWRGEALGSRGLTSHDQLCLMSLKLLPGNVPHL